MKREDKNQLVADLHQRMSQAKVALLTRFMGLNVGKMTQLRRDLRQGGVEYRIAKNTLLNLAIQGTDKQVLSSHLQGPIAVALSDTDPIAPARILAKYAKDFSELKILAAAADGKLFGPAQIQGWVNLPSLDELRGRILGMIQAPAVKLVRLANTPGTQLAQLLQAKSRQE